MNDVLHRLAVALLLIGGFVTAAQPLGSPDLGQFISSYGAAEPGPFAWSVTRHYQYMLVLIGLTLALSAFVPALRMSAISFALLTKAGFVVISLSANGPMEALTRLSSVEMSLLCILLAAGGVFLREAWQEARWHGMLRLRPEA